jgi:nucleoside triphosphate diphosphatase
LTDKKQYDISDLMYLMTRLRDPDTGCPWDLKQDFASIVPCTLEETYEVVDAIEREDYEHLREELGDLLFQVVFYSQLGAEDKLFDLHEVVDELVRKLVVRHPHVFPDETLTGKRNPDDEVKGEDIKTVWEDLKRKSRNDKGSVGRLADIPLALPALTRASKLQKRASNHGFDWTEIDPVIDKIDEELSELKEALDLGEIDFVEEELGDLVFACVNLARHAGLDAESVLRKANRKFESRFATMERQASDQSVLFESLTSDQKNQLWEEAKRIEKLS